MASDAHVTLKNEHKLVEVYKALKSDSRIKLEQSIKEGHLDYKQIMDGLVCNGQDPMSFAINKGSYKTAKM
jgi:hypothetical protein